VLNNRAAINDCSNTNNCVRVNDSSRHNNSSASHLCIFGYRGSWVDGADNFDALGLASFEEPGPYLVVTDTQDQLHPFGRDTFQDLFSAKDRQIEDSRSNERFIVIDEPCDILITSQQNVGDDFAMAPRSINENLHEPKLESRLFAACEFRHGRMSFTGNALTPY